MKAKVINIKDLDTSCWSIQIWGKEYCQICPWNRTKDCGGNSGNAKRIREGGGVKTRDFGAAG